MTGTLLRSPQRGRISLHPLFAPLAGRDPINYGDDASDYASGYASGGEGDDIRFTRSDATSAVFMVSDIGHNAADCRTLVDAVDAVDTVWQCSTIHPNKS